MKLSLKSFKIGDRIYYRFPKPALGVKNFLIGTIKRKGRNFIELNTDNQLVLRLENSHLEHIEAVERKRINI